MTTLDAPLSLPVTQQARCALHPDRPATLTCARCGAFICDTDRRQLGAGVFCPACAVRPDVDYLEAFRQSVWGKRDGWTWLVGFGAALNGLGAISALLTGAPVYGVVGLCAAAVGVCYFLGMRWARVGLLVTPLLVAAGGLVASFSSPLLTAFERGQRAGTFLGSMLIPMLVLTAMHFDTRNRLFFKLEVPREKLQKAWDLYSNNPMARAGLFLAVVSLIVPGLGLVSLPLSIVALTRVNPAAHPPIGRKGQAIAGIVFSGLSVVGWGAVFVASLLR